VRARVRLISLGGTIAGVPRDGGVVPGLDAGALLSAVPGVQSVAHLQAESLRVAPSGSLRFSDIAAAADRIQSALAEGIDGVVVTQGTDTIEETAFQLDLLLQTDRPVVVTGALRSPVLPGADGPANLMSAVRVAASPVARSTGVLVVMSDEIHAARFVRKLHTHKIAAFGSPGAGPLGWIAEDRVRIVLRPAQRAPTLRWRDEPPPVALIVITMGMSRAEIDAALACECAGVVVAAFGAGHIPSWIVDSLSAAARRVPVVLSSRTGAGECHQHSYTYAGGDRDLLARGLIPGGFLDPAKARVLLSLLLAEGADRARIREAFEWF
jgi:L-asparaginase